jgi:hypothetical protein
MSTKDAGMRIRIERELRDAFVQACQAQGLAASEVLRDFMRSFAAKHSSAQAVLFGATRNAPAAAGRKEPR